MRVRRIENPPIVNQLIAVSVLLWFRNSTARDIHQHNPQFTAGGSSDALIATPISAPANIYIFIH
tara:strand:+ start:463 stop:657 length:195 start_codon:yes stop_codon:yes gene_type:complete